MNNVRRFDAIYDEDYYFRKVIVCVICIVVPLGVGFLSGFLTRDSMFVFDTINKPMLTPPAVVFPIAWGILYFLMGISSFLALAACKNTTIASFIIFPYILQLVVNFFWSIIFFNGRLFGVALAVLALLWMLIIATMICFRSVSKVSFWLMLPYLIWVTFAGYLNVSIFFMN